MTAAPNEQLNDDFLNAAFDEEQQGRICTDSGDGIFLPAREELSSVFGGRRQLRCTATDYAVARGLDSGYDPKAFALCTENVCSYGDTVTLGSLNVTLLYATPHSNITLGTTPAVGYSLLSCKVRMENLSDKPYDYYQLSLGAVLDGVLFTQNTSPWTEEDFSGSG